MDYSSKLHYKYFLLLFMFVKNHTHVPSLEIDLLTLKMTLNNYNNMTYGMPSQNCMKKRGIAHVPSSIC